MYLSLVAKYTHAYINLFSWYGLEFTAVAFKNDLKIERESEKKKIMEEKPELKIFIGIGI